MDTKVTMLPGQKSQTIILKPDALDFFIMAFEPKSVIGMSLSYLDKENRCGDSCIDHVGTTEERRYLRKNEDYDFVAVQFSNGSLEKVSFTFRQI